MRNAAKVGPALAWTLTKRSGGDVNNFSGTILGTKGELRQGPKPQPKRHPGDKPLSPEGEAFKAKLWRETDISLHEHPERWTWKHIPETKEHQASAGWSKYSAS